MKRTLTAILFPCLLCVLFCACRADTKPQYQDISYLAMDTVITLRLPQNADSTLSRLCESRTRDIEALLSKTVSDSEISHFNSGESPISVSEDTKAVLSCALLVAEKTNGAYDPTVAPLTALWDVTAPSPRIPTEAEIEAALANVGYEYLTLDKNTLSKEDCDISLDLGGCAKGYACAEIIDILKDADLPFGIVSFGGNIGLFGKSPEGENFRVGIKDPTSPDQLAGYLSISDTFVSVSGDYERYFELDGERYHHIIDPTTGAPARSGVHSVAVVSSDAALADALSTALFVMGVENGMALYESGIFDFEALWYLSDNTTVITDGLSDKYEHSTTTFTPPKT